MSDILKEKKAVLRAILLHEFKRGDNATKVAKTINEGWGEGIIGDRLVRRWFENFCSGDMPLEDENGRSRPSELDDEELKELVESDLTQTVRELVAHMQVTKDTIDRHLQITGKVKKLDQWVPCCTKRTV